MRASTNFSLWVLLIAGATARLLMQMAAMAPYAGLDELFHVARLSFVRAEGRNPTMTERSVPRYLATIPHWPESREVVDRPVDRAYVLPNYEAQQPSLYYAIAARLVPARSSLFELRAWRMLSVFFALIAVLATAAIDERGFVAASLVVALPTWETLVVRASNDAFACAMVAIAIAATVRRKRIAEAVAWPLAIAAKLYTWPMLIVLPFLWRAQRAERKRVVATVITSAIGFGLTIAELAHRTKNPLGLFAFDPAPMQAASIHAFEMVKIWVFTLAWTSGQHWDALRPLGLILYIVPIIVVIVWSRIRPIAWWTIGAFALAQVINAAAYMRTAQNGMPAGGKEGWYWFALVPILVPAMLAPAVARFRGLVWWIVAWDVLITDCELIPTWAGLTSPAHPSLLFRWGPMHFPPAWSIAFRIVQIAALAATTTIVNHVHDRPDDLALSRP